MSLGRKHGSPVRVLVADIIVEFAAAADEHAPASLNPQFGRRQMAQEAQGAGCSGIGPRLEHAYQISHGNVRELYGAPKDVERRTKWAHYVNGLFRRLVE